MVSDIDFTSTFFTSKGGWKNIYLMCVICMQKVSEIVHARQQGEERDTHSHNAMYFARERLHWADKASNLLHLHLHTYPPSTFHTY